MQGKIIITSLTISQNHHKRVALMKLPSEETVKVLVTTATTTQHQ